MRYIIIIILIMAICPAMGQNATVSVGQPVSIVVQLHHATNRTLSALGYRWRLDNHMIYYVDQNSDCIGQVKIGDYLVSENGMSPETFTFQGHYLDDVNTSVRIVLSRNGYQYSITARRRPVSSFGPIWHHPIGCY